MNPILALLVKRTCAGMSMSGISFAQVLTADLKCSEKPIVSDVRLGLRRTESGSRCRRVELTALAGESQGTRSQGFFQLAEEA